MKNAFLKIARRIYRRLPSFLAKPLSVRIGQVRRARTAANHAAGHFGSTSIPAKSENDFIGKLRREFVDQGSNLEAARKCEAYLLANPEDADVWLFLASLYLTLAEPKKALDAVVKVAACGREAVTLFKAGRLTLNLCGVCDILDTTRVDGMQEPVIALVNELKEVCEPFVLAERCFDLAVRNAPTRGALTCAANVLAGAIEYNRGNVGRAEARFVAAKDDFPQEAWSFIYLSEIYKQRGDFPSAIAVLEDVRAREPRNVMVLIRLARLLARVGRIDEATAAARAVIDHGVVRRLDEIG